MLSLSHFCLLPIRIEGKIYYIPIGVERGRSRVYIIRLLLSSLEMAGKVGDEGGGHQPAVASYPLGEREGPLPLSPLLPLPQSCDLIPSLPFS